LKNIRRWDRGGNLTANTWSNGSHRDLQICGIWLVFTWYVPIHCRYSVYLGLKDMHTSLDRWFDEHNINYTNII
jgi:hypothetical protein